jgi:hypothetical protein
VSGSTPRLGKRQGLVLKILALVSPRGVPSQALSWFADPDGDLTRGRRIVLSLESRGLIERTAPPRPWVSAELARFRLTPDGHQALHSWVANGGLTTLGGR